MYFCFKNLGYRGRAVMVLVSLAARSAVFAQTDEIQVYNAEIAPRGVFNVMIHTNFTPIGRKTPRFPGGIIPNHSVNGAVEWAYGVTDWFEQGFYVPVWTPYSVGRGWTLDAIKLRELFVRPHARDHAFFYGVNFEVSINRHFWELKRFTSELRPIVGVHLQAVDIIWNPIMDTNYTGGFGNLEFAPDTRVAYNFSSKWAAAVEEYAGVGPLNQFLPLNHQFHETWAVMDHWGKTWSIEAGIGFGVTPGADTITLKLMVARDFNFRGKSNLNVRGKKVSDWRTVWDPTRTRS